MKKVDTLTQLGIPMPDEQQFLNTAKSDGETLWPSPAFWPDGGQSPIDSLIASNSRASAAPSNGGAEL